MGDIATPPKSQVAPVEPLLVDDATAAALLGIGTSFFCRLLDRGAIGPVPVRLGKRKLHRVDLLRRWVQAGLPCRADWIALSANLDMPSDGRACGGPSGATTPDTQTGGGAL